MYREAHDVVMVTGYDEALAVLSDATTFSSCRGEFIGEFAGPYSLLVIADLLGVPQEDRGEFASVLWRRSAGVGSAGEGTLEHGPLG